MKLLKEKFRSLVSIASKIDLDLGSRLYKLKQWEWWQSISLFLLKWKLHLEKFLIQIDFEISKDNNKPCLNLEIMQFNNELNTAVNLKSFLTI